MTMLERMARAMGEAFYSRAYDHLPAERRKAIVEEIWKEQWAAMALAALQAMREPTEAMLVDGQKQVKLSDVTDEYISLSRDEIASIWQAAIDAAIAEAEPR